MNESPTPQSIVVGIDGSRAAIHAALWAVDEAVSRDIPLRLLYAIEPDELSKPPRTGRPRNSPSQKTLFVTRSQRSRPRTSRSRSKWRSPRSGRSPR
ncbi:MAG TPA: universal stress protein [Mycobacterium sp.]